MSIQKWGRLASFVMPVALIAALMIAILAAGTMVLAVWTTLVAGVTGAGWHFLG